jgi:hypothetical protein
MVLAAALCLQKSLSLIIYRALLVVGFAISQIQML